MHQQQLQQLLDYSDDLDRISSALKPYGLDFEMPVVVLTRAHIKSILTRYLQGALTEQDLEDWGNAIEGREDIAYEANYEEQIGDAIHQLANPLLTVPISQQSIQRFLLTL